MTNEKTRLTAIRALLDDEIARKNRAKWEAILEDKSLAPTTQSEAFQKDFFDLLITEMEEGYQRNDEMRRAKRRKTGRRSGYIPPQMRINSTIGRFLFAYFKWHTPYAISPNIGITTKGLKDIAEAFGFRIDSSENQRQFLKTEERQTIINKEKNWDYNKNLIKMTLGSFGITLIFLFIFYGGKIRSYLEYYN